MKQPVNKTRPIGPCYNCAGWSHLANSCPKGKQQPYPLIVSKPVVSGLDCAVCNVNVLDDYTVKQPADGISGVSAQVPDGGTSSVKSVDDTGQQIAEVKAIAESHMARCEGQYSPTKISHCA